MAAQSEIDAVTCRSLARNCVFLLEGNAFPSATMLRIFAYPFYGDRGNFAFADCRGCNGYNGGGIYKSTGTLRISNCKINDATARNCGGGAYCSGSITIKSSALFSDNEASPGNGAHLTVGVFYIWAMRGNSRATTMSIIFT